MKKRVAGLSTCKEVCDGDPLCTGFAYYDGSNSKDKSKQCLFSKTKCATRGTNEFNWQGWGVGVKPPPSGLKPLVDKGGNPLPTGTGQLNECEGDCDRDNDCAPGLKCFQRGTSAEVPPGCAAGGSGDVGSHDYCYKPEPACESKAGYDISGASIEYSPDKNVPGLEECKKYCTDDPKCLMGYITLEARTVGGFIKVNRCLRVQMLHTGHPIQPIGYEVVNKIIQVESFRHRRVAVLDQMWMQSDALDLGPRLLQGVVAHPRPPVHDLERCATPA